MGGPSSHGSVHLGVTFSIPPQRPQRDPWSRLEECRQEAVKTCPQLEPMWPKLISLTRMEEWRGASMHAGCPNNPQWAAFMSMCSGFSESGTDARPLAVTPWHSVGFSHRQKPTVCHVIFLYIIGLICSCCSLSTKAAFLFRSPVGVRLGSLGSVQQH